MAKLRHFSAGSCLRSPLSIPAKRLAQRIVGVRDRRTRGWRVREPMQQDEVVYRAKVAGRRDRHPGLLPEEAIMGVQVAAHPPPPCKYSTPGSGAQPLWGRTMHSDSGTAMDAGDRAVLDRGRELFHRASLDVSEQAALAPTAKGSRIAMRRICVIFLPQAGAASCLFARTS